MTLHGHDRLEKLCLDVHENLSGAHPSP